MKVITPATAKAARTAGAGHSRRGLFGRLGAVMVGAAAIDILESKQAFACSPPPGCYGLPSCDCHGGGCPGSPSGGCCWIYTDPYCYAYKCCDHTCADGTYGICRYFIGKFC